MRQIALALRSELYKPEELLEFSKLTDDFENASHIFFPDLPGGQDAIAVAASCLALTKRIMMGSGVIRILEHEGKILARRLATTQWLSNSRLVLGVGTGSPGAHPKETIDKLFSALDELRKNFPANFHGQELTFPEIFVATLKSGIASRARGRAKGLILNFCSPEYAGRLLSEAKIAGGGGGPPKSIVCYVKLFYSERKELANKLLAEEFLKYDGFPQYHAMFEKDGVTQAIGNLRSTIKNNQEIEIPEELNKISVANPTKEELVELFEAFRKAGVNIPCAYPYYAPDESTAFKRETLKELLSCCSS